ESQERMLIVCEKGREDELEAIFKKWDLNAAKIGEVTDDPRVRIYWHGELVADVEADHLVLGGGAPVYIRETRRPAYLDEIELDLASISDVAAGPQLDSNGQGRSDRTSQPQSSRAQTSQPQSSRAQTSQPQSSRAQTSQLPSSRAQTYEAQTSEAQTFEADTSRTQAPGLPNTASDVLLRLLGSPNIASKRWVFEQYDTMVRSNTVVGPGPSDAAVVRIKGTNRGLAVKTDC